MGATHNEIRVVIEIHGLNHAPPEGYGGAMPQLRIAQGETRMDALGPLIDQYCDYLLLKENTPTYVTKVKKLCRRACADIGWAVLDDITTDSFAAWIRAHRENNRAAKTRNNYRNDVHGWCGWLVKMGHLQRNPIDLVPLAKVTDETPKMVLTEAQVEALIEASKTEKRAKDRWLGYMLAAYTGLRQGEIQGLKVSMFRGGGTPHFLLPPKLAKSKKEEKAYIPEWFVPIIVRHIASKKADQKVVAARVDKWESFERDRVRAGVPKNDESGAVCTFHCLRHFFCTELDRKGVDRETRQVLMRHRSTKMTDRYTHADGVRFSKKVSQIGSSPLADDDDGGLELVDQEHDPMQWSNGGGGSNPLTPIQSGNDPQTLTGEGLPVDTSASGVLATQEHADGDRREDHKGNQRNAGSAGPDQQRATENASEVSRVAGGVVLRPAPRPLPHHDREDRPAQAQDVTDSLSCRGEGGGRPPLTDHNSPASGSPCNPGAGVEPGAGRFHITQADFEREIGRAYLAGRRDGSADWSTT